MRGSRIAWVVAGVIACVAVVVAFDLTILGDGPNLETAPQAVAPALELGSPSARPARLSVTIAVPTRRVVRAAPFRRRRFPEVPDLKAAELYLEQRGGVSAFAVIDNRGALHSWHGDEQFVSASVVKAMLLVAYLRHHGMPSSDMSNVLYAMIHYSDNDAANTTYYAVGDAQLMEVARLAGMEHFSVSGYWSGAQITAIDQARFFLAMDKLLPEKTRAYAADLFSGIADYESWGIPKVARPQGWEVWFKGGWRGTDRGQLVHQVARLRKGDSTFSLAVLTDGGPSMAYGIDTIEGVTKRILGD